MYIDGGAVLPLEVVDGDAVSPGSVERFLDALAAVDAGSSGDAAGRFGEAGDDDDEQEIGLATQRFAEHAGGVERPEVLVFEVNQSAGAPERLDVGAGDAAFSFGRIRVGLAAPRIGSQYLNGVRTIAGWVDSFGREPGTLGRLPRKPVQDPSEGSAGVEWSRIFPAFTERQCDVVDRRSV